ncbi:MAG: hypothetical protein WD407_04595 [Rhodospirillales bacterium]
MTTDLFQHRANVYSQNGEDGILRQLLSSLDIEKGYFVEFGAWDGKHWSNTYHCYERGWTGCYIEGMESRFNALQKNIPDERILKINSYIEADGPNSLDEILHRHGVKTIDLLSIDIDSDDLTIWEGVKKYRPSVVVIEYNSTIPFDTRYRNAKGKLRGNSALSIMESAASRGYTLVEGTDTNLIFVLSDLAFKSEIQCKSLQEIKDQTFNYRVFFGHDGTLMHDYKLLNDAGITEIYPVPFAMSFGIQPVPRWLRKVRIRTNYLGLAFFCLFALVRCPIQLIRLIALTVRTLAQGRGAVGFIKLILSKDRMVETLKNSE